MLPFRSASSGEKRVKVDFFFFSHPAASDSGPMHSWANPNWHLSNITGGVSRGLGHGLGYAASHAIVDGIRNAKHRHDAHKKEEEEEERRAKQELKHHQDMKHTQSSPAAINEVHASAPAADHVDETHAAYFTAPTRPDTAPPARPPPSVHIYAVCIRKFEGHTPAELSIELGDQVEVLHPDPSGWTEVSKKSGQRGWVPATYLHNIEDDELVQAKAQARSASWSAGK